VVLSLMVVGPLLGGGVRIAEWLGVGPAFALFWSIARWPVAFAVVSAFLAWLYRVAPNVRNTWRASLPGAITATTAIILIAVGLRAYLGVAGPRAPEVGEASEALEVASQTIGAILAVILWIWLSSVAILTGGVLNAELRRRKEAKVAKRPAAATGTAVSGTEPVS
jgi:membrane protein